MRISRTPERRRISAAPVRRPKRPFRQRAWRLLPRRTRWALEERWSKRPWVKNEGEATAEVVNMCFGGYPMLADFETKEDAVRLLAAIWDVVDNWDGSRINVKWAAGEKNVWEWARSAPGQDVPKAEEGSAL